jgi:hypothetical protein
MTEFTPMRVPRARFTKLDVCGTPSTAACAMRVTKGTIEIEITGEQIERKEAILENGDAELLSVDTTPPSTKWLNVTLTMTGVEPDYFSWLTGCTIIYDDAATPVAIGIADEANGAALGNAAFEGWTRLAGQSCSAGYPVYGYVLLPWLVEGTFLETKFNSGLLETKLVCRTQTNSPWGVGPYPVLRSQAVATLNQPRELTAAVGAHQNRLLMKTTLAYPLVTASCGLVTGPLAVVDTDAGGPLLGATATLPTTTGAIPGVIDWGDLTAPVVVSAGPTVTHTYAVAGLYTVTYRSSAQSGQKYVGSVTVA